MSRLLIICGPSASGKDTLLKKLVEGNIVLPLVSHTSRPKRKGETDGVEYHFISKEDFLGLIENDMLIEYRKYHTKVNDVDDIWYYGLVKRALSPYSTNAIIVDVQGAKDLIAHYGKENCSVLYLDTPEDIRRERCRGRGDYDQSEFDRRAADDAMVFSETNLKELNATMIKAGELTINQMYEECLVYCAK